MNTKGRQPDKPGTFRIRPGKHGGMRLSGVRADGSRVRMGGLTDREANELASRLFPSSKPAPTAAPIVDWESSAKDDWGIPLRVSDETIASVASTLKIPDVAQEVPKPPQDTKEEVEKKERRAKNAKSLMDLAAIGAGAGVVIMSRRLTEAVGKEPVKPDPKQVNDFRDSTRETLTEWFGEKEIAAWQMMILLGLGIPISMMLQSPRKKVEEEKPDKKPGNLASVP